MVGHVVLAHCLDNCLPDLHAVSDETFPFQHHTPRQHMVLNMSGCELRNAMNVRTCVDTCVYNHIVCEIVCCTETTVMSVVSTDDV